MSNGEDVLDSWEEIDEAELEKSLHLQKTGKEQKVILETDSPNFGKMKLLLRPSLDATGSNAKNDSNADNELSGLDTMSHSFKPVIMMLNKTNDEYQSVNYTAPIANQTVKILRRPTQQSERRNGIAKPKQPIKTLQQREQEYAEARLRIMGAAKNPDDDLSNVEKQKKVTNVNVPNTAKPSTSDMATSSVNAWEKPESTDKPMPPYAFMENNVTGPATVYGGNFSKANFIPPQNYCYPGVPPVAAAAAACGADMYGNRSMTMMAMPPQPPLLSAQTYPHLNTAHFPLHQQNRQFHKQFSLPNQGQNMQQKSWPTIMNSGVSGIGNAVPHPKLLIQQQQQQHQQQHNQQKGVYLKNHNSNKTNNQNQNQNQNQNESILRLPRGPDGSHGFQVRR